MGIRKLSAHGVRWPMVALPNYDDNGLHRFSQVMTWGGGGREGMGWYEKRGWGFRIWMGGYNETFSFLGTLLLIGESFK